MLSERKKMEKKVRGREAGRQKEKMKYQPSNVEAN